MVDLFDTHKFFFTLNHDNRVKGHRVIFIDRDDIQKEILLEKIEIGTSPVSCKLFDKEGNRYLVPFIRIREVYLGKELVWTNKDKSLDDTKVIKGF